MAITTQLVGQLGGGKVGKIEINFVSPSSMGTYDVVTVPIPAGVPHIVVLEMKTIEATTTSANLAPNIYFGTVNKGAYSTSFGPFSAGGAHSSPVVIKAQRNSTGTSASFTGTVYYTPIGN